MLDNWIIGVVSASAGIFMAIKNKLSWFLVAFSGVLSFFLGISSKGLVEYKFGDVDSDITYTIGFLVGMTSTFIINNYDSYLKDLADAVSKVLTGFIGKFSTKNKTEENEESK